MRRHGGQRRHLRREMTNAVTAIEIQHKFVPTISHLGSFVSQRNEKVFIEKVFPLEFWRATH